MSRLSLWLIVAACLSGCQFGVTADPFYEAVLKTQPRNPGAVYLQGQHMYGQGQFSRAEAYFQRMTSVAPNDPAGWIGLGQTELELERPARAEKAFRRAIGLAGKPLPEAEYGLASALVFQNKLEAAREQIDKIEKTRGVSGGTERLRGDLAFMARDYPEALRRYQQSLAQAPNQPDLHRRVQGLAKLLGAK
ncbi:MAG: tetratricopeptide repeat protein [Candidatus Sumerlaeia bacterium]